MMTPIFAVVSASSNSNLSGAISSRSPDNIQGKIQGISSSISGMAYAVPQLISGIVASIFGFKGPFIAAAIMYTIATLAFYRSRKHINNL
jgi:MFS family permease